MSSSFAPPPAFERYSTFSSRDNTIVPTDTESDSSRSPSLKRLSAALDLETGSPVPLLLSSPSSPAGGKPPGPFSGKGRDFWLVFVALCVSCFLSAIDLTGVSTVLPTSKSPVAQGLFGPTICPPSGSTGGRCTLMKLAHLNLPSLSRACSGRRPRV